MPIIQQSQGRYHVTIPTRFIENLHWYRGTNVEFFLIKDSLVVKERVYDIARRRIL